MSPFPRLKLGARAADPSDCHQVLRLSSLLSGRRVRRGLRRLVTLVVIVSCVSQPVSPAVAYVPGPEATASTPPGRPEQAAQPDAPSGAAGARALAAGTPSPAPPAPTPVPDASTIFAAGKPLKARGRPIGGGSGPIILSSVLPHEQDVSPSDVTPSALSEHWWHRVVHPDEDPWHCPGGGANMPNRVMYGTDNCNLLYLTVVDPADNEQYVWRFYDPQGNFYTSASATFMYPDNPANPCASHYPGWYAWALNPPWPESAICFDYKPSAWDLGWGLKIAEYKPSWTAGKWRVDVTSEGVTVLSEYFIMRPGPNADPPRTYATESCDLSTDPTEFAGQMGDPVNPYTGNYTRQRVDLSLPGQGFPLTFERSYNSLDAAHSTALGYGWTHNYNVRLEFSTEVGVNFATLVAPRGSHLEFSQQPNGTFAAGPGVQASLVRNPDGSYTLTTSAQQRYTFDATGRLTGMADPQGNAQTLTYSGSELASVEDANGRALEFHHDANGRIDRLSDPAGRQVGFTYDGASNLTVVTDTRGLATTMTYDANHRLLTVVDANGEPELTLHYDGQNRVDYQLDGLNRQTTFTYTPGMTQTVATDPEGNRTTYQFNKSGLLPATVDGLGAKESYTYDGNYNRTGIADRNGNQTKLTWTSCGCQPESVTDPDGNTTHLYYDANNNPTKITDANNKSTTFGYSGTLLTRATDALGHTALYTYTAQGLLLAQSDPLGHTTGYTYDALGQPTSTSDALANLTLYGYDLAGRLITTTDSLGRVTVNEYDDGDHLVRVTRNYLAGQPQNHQDQYNLITEYGYDGAGRKTVITDTLGRVTLQEYDPAGRRVRVTQNAWPGQPQNYRDEYNLVTQYTYDSAGRVLDTIDTASRVTRNTYDAAGNLATITENYLEGQPQNYQDQYNLITRYGRDKAGNVVTQTDTLGRLTVTGYDDLNRPVTVTTNYVDGVFNAARPDQDLVTVSTYDAVGNLVTTTDPAGQVTRYEHDALGRPITVTVNYLAGQPQNYQDQYNLITRYEYDPAGHRVRATDTLGQVTYTEYDALDRALRVTQNYLPGQPQNYQDQYNLVTTYGYSAVGRLVAVTDTLGVVTRSEYDALGRLAAQVDAAGQRSEYTYDPAGNKTSAEDPTGVVVEHRYDLVGRLQEVWGPLGRLTTYAYDAVSNLTAVTDANDHTTHYTYDRLDRQKTVRDPLQGLTVYAYDPAGNLTQATDAGGHASHYDYDELNRLLSATDPLSHTTRYAYDAVGNTTVITDADQLVTAFSYNDAHRLTGVQYPDSSVSYGYDALGNRLSMTDGTGTTTYAYDSLHRPLTITAPYAGPVGYRYDPLGNRTRILYPSGDAVTYDYDATGRLVSVGGWDSQEATYGYDAAGRVLWQRQPNGVQTDYGYDPAGRLVRVEHSDWQDWVASYEYTLDPAGNRVAVTETTTALLTFHLPSLGKTRLSVPTGAWLEPVTLPSALAEGEAITYSYDAADRLIAAGYASGEYYGYAYDAVGNRTLLTTTAGTTAYVYDAANRLVSVDGVPCTYDNRGNLLSDGTWTYTYNGAGRMVRAETITATQVYTYSGDGLLVAQSIDGVEATFTWDQAVEIPQVLATSDGTKSLYGLERLAVLQGGAWHYPQHDAIGSVRQWTDPAGAVLSAQSYSPFGVPRAALAVAPWGFTGEWHDPGGLVYLRARWYNPGLGRLTQPDAAGPNRADPQTLNRYTYANNDPLRYTDPSGHYVFEENPDHPYFSPPGGGLPAMQEPVDGDTRQIPLPVPSLPTDPSEGRPGRPCRRRTATPAPTATSTPTTAPYSEEEERALARTLWCEEKETYMEEERMTAVGFVAMNSVGKWDWPDELIPLLRRRFCFLENDPVTGGSHWETALGVARSVLNGTAQDVTNGSTFEGDAYFPLETDCVYLGVKEHSGDRDFWCLPIPSEEEAAKVGSASLLIVTTVNYTDYAGDCVHH